MLTDVSVEGRIWDKEKLRTRIAEIGMEYRIIDNEKGLREMIYSTMNDKLKEALHCQELRQQQAPSDKEVTAVETEEERVEPKEITTVEAEEERVESKEITTVETEEERVEPKEENDKHMKANPREDTAPTEFMSISKKETTEFIANTTKETIRLRRELEELRKLRASPVLILRE